MCTERISAPAFLNCSAYFAGSSIIKCRSQTFVVAFLKNETSMGPKLMFGTKRPSIISKWNQSAWLSFSILQSVSRSRKFAERREGATMGIEVVLQRKIQSQNY